MKIQLLRANNFWLATETSRHASVQLYLLSYHCTLSWQYWPPGGSLYSARQGTMARFLMSYYTMCTSISSYFCLRTLLQMSLRPFKRTFNTTGKNLHVCVRWLVGLSFISLVCQNYTSAVLTGISHFNAYYAGRQFPAWTPSGRLSCSAGSTSSRLRASSLPWTTLLSTSPPSLAFSALSSLT